MTLFRALLIIMAGVFVGLLEWLVLTVFPVMSVVRVSLIVVSIVVLRQYISAALLFGMSSLLVFDIGSFLVFPAHMVSFLLCVLIILLLFNRLVTHRAFFGYLLGGLIMIAGHRVFVGVFSWLLTDLSFSDVMLRYPSVWLEVFISFAVYAIVVFWLYRRWKIIHVDWPRAA